METHDLQGVRQTGVGRWGAAAMAARIWARVVVGTGRQIAPHTRFWVSGTGRPCLHCPPSTTIWLKMNVLGFGFGYMVHGFFFLDEAQ